MMAKIPYVLVFDFFVLVPNCYHVLFVDVNGEIAALITLRKTKLANRLIMRSSSVLSFISEVSSLNYSSYSFSCSLDRFITQQSVSLGELSEQ